MKIKPLNDWAVIVPTEAAGRTAGGLYIPDAAKEKPAEGVVEAIGPGALEEEGYGKKKKEKKDRKFIPTTVKPGDRVLFESYAKQKIEIGGQERLLVREINILGVLAGDASPSLLLPERTGPSGSTSLATLAMTAITANAPAQPLKRPGQAKAAPAKRTAAKPKKAAKKPAAKKAAAPKKKAAPAKKKPAKKKR